MLHTGEIGFCLDPVRDKNLKIPNIGQQDVMGDETVLSIEIKTDDAQSKDVVGKTDPATATNGHRVHSVKPAQLMRLMSQRNVELLRLIRVRKPQSVSELARISGRPKASLTRTLQRLAGHGIIVMRKSAGRGKAPTVACDRLRLELALTPKDED